MNLWSSWKPSFLSRVYFPWVFLSFFELTIQTWLFGKLNVCKTCKACPFRPFAPIFFRRDYTENFAPIGPSWALAHIQTAVPKLPGVWYMHLGPGFFTEGPSCSTFPPVTRKIIVIRKRHFTSQIYILPTKTAAFTFLWKFWWGMNDRTRKGSTWGCSVYSSANSLLWTSVAINQRMRSGYAMFWTSGKATEAMPRKSRLPW